MLKSAPVVSCIDMDLQWVGLGLPCQGTDQLIFAAITMPELWHTACCCGRARALRVHVGHPYHKTYIKKDSDIAAAA